MGRELTSLVGDEVARSSKLSGRTAEQCRHVLGGGCLEVEPEHDGHSREVVDDAGQFDREAEEHGDRREVHAPHVVGVVGDDAELFDGGLGQAGRLLLPDPSDRAGRDPETLSGETRRACSLALVIL